MLEFSDVARAAEERRIIRKNLRAERKLQIRSASGQMYQRMLFIFEDFAHQRRTLRLGFNRWLEVLGKTPKQSAAKRGDDLQAAAIHTSSPQVQNTAGTVSDGNKSNNQHESDEDEQQPIQKQR